MRLVRQRLLELAAQDQNIQVCNQAALDGALMLDRMEEDDAAINRFEVWMIDFGMVAKVRPALLLTGAPAEDDRHSPASHHGAAWEPMGNLCFKTIS